MVKKLRSRLSIFVISLLLLINSSNCFATNNGDVECGTIQGSTFYTTTTYPPPNGTPVTNGACTWTKQGTASCGTGSYGGQSYTLYTYKYICNVPLDGSSYLLFGATLILAIYYLNRRVELNNSTGIF